jgi:hypothetical protein
MKGGEKKKNNMKGKDIADMGITFDHYGRVMDVKKENPDHYPVLNTGKELIKSKISTESFAQKSNSMLKLEARKLK